MDAQVSRSDIRRHLSILFEQGIEEHGLKFCVFSIPDLRPVFFQAIDPAVEYCAERAIARQNVYVSMGMVRRPPRDEKSRGAHDDFVGVSCFWADVDVVDELAHKSKAYPRSVEEAMAVSKIGGLDPSYVVHSGFGLHCYYVLDEPIIFDDPQARSDAHMLVKRCVATVRCNAEAMGYTIDSTNDLARVLRVAGTLNWKGMEPRQVRLVAPDVVRRFSVAALDERFVASDYAERGAGVVGKVAPFVINPDVRISESLLASLRANADLRFQETWGMARRDFADQSPSTYEFSLANALVDAEFNDQDIVDILVAWRRDVAKKPKNRVDYYQRTIGKVRASRESKKAAGVFTSDAGAGGDLPQSPTPETVTSGERAAMLRHLSGALKISIAGFVQLNADNAEYFVRLENGEEFSVGRVGQITRFQMFSDRVLERCNVMIPLEMQKCWPRVVQMLFAVVERKENDSPRLQDRARNMIADYLGDTQIYSDEEWDKALPEHYPFVRSGMVWIHKSSFIQWAKKSRGAAMSEHEVERDFHLLGMKSEKHDSTIRGRRRRASYWGLPCDDFEDFVVRGVVKS